jgi:hypothetical protein
MEESNSGFGRGGGESSSRTSSLAPESGEQLGFSSQGSRVEFESRLEPLLFDSIEWALSGLPFVVMIVLLCCFNKASSATALEGSSKCLKELDWTCLQIG